MDVIKRLRRAIIAICLVILTISGFESLPESKYGDKSLKTLVNTKKAQVIEVGEEMKIDKDTILIKRIINTEDKTYIRYALVRFEQGWSFSGGAINIFDDKGNQYRYNGGQSSGKLWGQDGLISFDRINEDAKYITLKLEWYDRKNEMKILLEKEGENNESK